MMVVKKRQEARGKRQEARDKSVVGRDRLEEPFPDV